MAHPYVLLLLAMLMFSGNFIVGKAFSDTIPPLTLSFMRFAMAAVILLPLGWQEIMNNKALWRQEWRPLAGLALTLGLFNVMLYTSVHYTTTINASIVDALTPAVAAMLGFLFLKERLLSKQVAGIIISFAGVVWIVSRGSLGTLLSLSINPGDLLMLLGVVSWAVYSIFIKQYGHRFPFYGGIIMTMVFGAVFLLPAAAFEWRDGFPIEWTVSHISGLLYIGIFPSALAILLWNRGVAEVGPSQASIFFNLVPLFTTVAAVLFLGESFGLVQLVGGALVLGGVYIATKP
ncbi:DMT family transporter [Bacillus sp. FJAT-44742]|uniref:DMT family transporter n=1 Tax=Bacillus sp. FJAT-44742 TaxID=2014005 RepID=UPI000C24F6FA|nr:DMT family transporter [Bacillus sp. FJAT-44742]